MKALIKLFIKDFLVSGIIFGVLMTVADKASGTQTPLLMSVIRAALFGLVLAIYSAIRLKRILKQLGITAYTEEIVKLPFRKLVPVEISREELIKKLIEDPEIKNMTIDAANDIIVIKPEVQDKRKHFTILLKQYKSSEGIPQIEIKIKERIIRSSKEYVTGLKLVLHIQQLFTGQG